MRKFLHRQILGADLLKLWRPKLNRKQKKELVESLHKTFLNSQSVIVTHINGLTVSETTILRSNMRDANCKFKVTKNSLTKLALANTQIESISDLFKGPTAVAYSADPIASAKVAVEYKKKYKNFKILGGAFEGKKVDEEKITFLASLPSLEGVRSSLIGLLLAPAQKIASVIQEPAGQLARLMSSRKRDLETSN